MPSGFGSAMCVDISLNFKAKSTHALDVLLDQFYAFAVIGPMLQKT